MRWVSSLCSGQNFRPNKGGLMERIKRVTRLYQKRSVRNALFLIFVVGLMFVSGCDISETSPPRADDGQSTLIPTTTLSKVPTPDPTFTPTSTDTPLPTSTATPRANDGQNTLIPTTTPSKAPTPDPTSTPTATDTPMPTSTATPRANARQSALTPTSTPPNVPTPDPTSTPTSTDTPMPTSTATPVLAPILVSVSAEDLSRDYASNEVAAKAKYEGKQALITGEVLSIRESGINYDIGLAPGTSTFFWVSIGCEVDRAQQSAVLELNKGQVVTLLGKIRRDEDTFGIIDVDVVIDDCVIQRENALIPTSIPSNEPTSTTTPVVTPTLISVSAKELSRDYANNEVAAKVKYEGKQVLITGEVLSIRESGINYDIGLASGTSTFFWVSIGCEVDRAQQAAVLELNKGQVVTLLGKIRRDEDTFGIADVDIVIDDCVIQIENVLIPTSIPSNEPTSTTTPVVTPTLISVSAKELSRDYANNEVAAKVKYEGKQALITGEVLSIRESGINYDVSLASGTSTFFWVSIGCEVDRAQQAAVLELNEGQVVTLLGKIRRNEDTFGIIDIDIVVDDCVIQR